jgi:hypothetical protein
MAPRFANSALPAWRRAKLAFNMKLTKVLARSGSVTLTKRAAAEIT